MVKHLEYFVGKPCSIFTTPTNRNLKDECARTYPKSVFNYFMGIVEYVHSSGPSAGIVLRRLNGKTKSFIALSHIVSIAEEELLDPNVPEHAKMIDEFHEMGVRIKDVNLDKPLKSN